MTDLLAFAHELADVARAIVRPAFRRLDDVEDKADGSPVTAIDRAVEQAMRERIADRFPTHGVFGEEFGEHQPDAEHLWILDPIDGTRPFVAGLPTFGCLIGLRRGAELTLGVIEQPVTQDRWVAQDGHGAWLNGERVRVRPPSARPLMLSPGPRSHLAAVWPAVDRAQALADRVVHGGECLSFGLLAAGQADCVVDGSLKLYDIAAPAVIVREAGGVITDWGGRRPEHPDFDGGAIGSNDPALHERLLAVLQQA